MATTLTARVRRHVLDVSLTLDLDEAPVTVLFGPSGGQDHPAALHRGSGPARPR